MVKLSYDCFDDGIFYKKGERKDKTEWILQTQHWFVKSYLLKCQSPSSWSDCRQGEDTRCSIRTCTWNIYTEQNECNLLFVIWWVTLTDFSRLISKFIWARNIPLCLQIILKVVIRNIKIVIWFVVISGLDSLSLYRGNENWKPNIKSGSKVYCSSQVIQVHCFPCDYRQVLPLNCTRFKLCFQPIENVTWIPNKQL